MAWIRCTRGRLMGLEWDERGCVWEEGVMTGYMIALSAMARIFNFVLKYRGIRGFQAIVIFHIF